MATALKVRLKIALLPPVADVGTAKKFLTYTLVAFALISIGFAFGKYSVKSDGADWGQKTDQGKYVAVYYMHSSFRCVTCNTIEKMTRELLDDSYAEELARGQIRWHEINFQENETLAAQFEVMASCVVVAQVESGRVVEFKRLDEVWTLMQEPASFNNYISSAIDSYLKLKGGQL